MKQFKFTFEAMTTYCEVILYDINEINAYNCFEKIKENTLFLEKKYNFYDKNSYLNKTINNRKRNKIKVDKQSSEVLKRVKYLSSLTKGVFDISIGTIKACYNEKTIKKIEDSISVLKTKMGQDSWKIEDSYLSFRYKETKLDLGGVIKEYAVDEAARLVKEFSINNALINFGGDIISIGEKPSGESFSVGIKNPNNPSENIIYIDIKNQALTTSASYERFKILEDKKLSHIIGKNFKEEDIVSSTIISDSALVSGIFSTAFMLDTSIDIPNELKVLLIDKELNFHQNITT